MDKITVDINKVNSLIDGVDMPSVDEVIKVLLLESGIEDGIENKRWEELTVLSGLFDRIFIKLSTKERLHLIRIFSLRHDSEYIKYLEQRNIKKDNRDMSYV